MSTADIKVGTSGTCEVAPIGTALPTNAGTALDNSFVDLGEITADGLEAAFDTSSEVIRNWAGEPVRVVISETSKTFKLTFLETNKDVLSLYYGSDVTSQLGDYSKLLVGQPDATPKSMVITLVDSADGSIKRYVIPRASVTEREPVMEKNEEATAYGVTIEAMYDATIGGLCEIQYDNDLTS